MLRLHVQVICGRHSHLALQKKFFGGFPQLSFYTRLQFQAIFWGKWLQKRFFDGSPVPPSVFFSLSLSLSLPLSLYTYVSPSFMPFSEANGRVRAGSLEDSQLFFSTYLYLSIYLSIYIYFYNMSPTFIPSSETNRWCLRKSSLEGSRSCWSIRMSPSLLRFFQTGRLLQKRFFIGF